ncbi:STAS domain-containing protein [Amycolatopsis sp. K13G38]|uniref:Anti-sigma factor antagonist n=1 Tax=Amycolatopsis acididurans TaxID=2724524 RepID=A0ABX1IX59_9PSEU|nr:STAS domain-containing protein [Amycolatopsis acididurans]NKQ52083.1 STAS domain-containing protein [Amycolatopsis acididurans]
MREDEAIHPSANAVKVEAGGETGRIRLLGEIDHTAVQQLDRAVSDLLDQGVQRLVVDFADLSFFDSACISALVRARTMAEERGGTITLANVNKYARRILDLTGLSAVFALDES